MPACRYTLQLAYDGADFHGWQRQLPPDPTDPSMRTELRTAQGETQAALRDLLREPTLDLIGASRTDSGVHAGGRLTEAPEPNTEHAVAEGQLAAFTTTPKPSLGIGWPAERSAEALVRALNGKLPRDLLCLGAELAQQTESDEIADPFNPIAAAASKCYSYTFATGQVRPLWDRSVVFHTWHELDPIRMDDAARAMEGEHDFAAFAQIAHGRKTTVRTIHHCRVRTLPEQRDACPRFVVEVAGSGFLYNMVRIIAGTLMEVGRGKIDPADVPEIIRSTDRTKAGPTMPPQGLCLEWIRYRRPTP